ncbi:MAG TPA: sugar phosphate isomerase/epimerase [Firmicutes bacterium]|nr:sugar phosphate isomerase/epimerase [Bacillota bacterium]
MPRIGLSTVCFLARPFWEGVEFALAHGIPHLEVYSDIPHAWPAGFPPEERARLKKMLESAGVTVSVHSPAYGLNLASLNPGLRRESEEQVVAAVRLARDLGAENVVVHGGSEHFLHAQMGSETRQRCREVLVASLEKCASEAERAGVVLCLENLAAPGALPRTLDEVAETVRRLNHPALRVALDLAHFELCREPVASLTAAADIIRHVHLSDNRQEEDSHLPLGEGTVDFTPFREFLRSFGGPVVMEIEDVNDPGGKALASWRWLAGFLG